MDNPNQVLVQRYTLKDLARLYNISWKTMQKWMKADEPIVGKRTGQFFSGKQVAQIFELRGYPKVVIDFSKKMLGRS